MSEREAMITKLEVDTDEVLGPARLSRFGPDAIDRAINAALVNAIPEGERTAILDMKLTSSHGEKVLTGVVAGNLGHGWGAALGGAIDLEDRDDWEVELLVRKSW